MTVAADAAAAHAGDGLLVRSLGAAQAALRDAFATHGRALDVTIHLNAGVHRVPRGGLVLTALDSPAAGHTVSWVGAGRAATVVSGGENVTGWSLAADPSLPAGTYRAPVPAALTDSSRQLYVDGVRASRTSRLASDVLPSLALEDRADCVACSYTVPSSLPLTWSNPGDVEFVYSGVASGWSESRCAVSAVSAAPPMVQPNCTLNPSAASESDCGFTDSTPEECSNNKTAAHPDGCCWHPGGARPSGHWCIAPAYPPSNATAATRITMRQPCFWNLVNRPFQPIGGRAPITVQNVREHLSEPGSWYLDRARAAIYYIPLPGQDMGAVDAVIAVEETLLALDGAARQAFAGTAFAFATWLRPSQDAGFVDQQSAACSICPYGTLMAQGCGGDDVYIVTPGNVALTGASDVAFDNCTFSHLGAYAASARGGSQRVSWRGCAFSDVSGGAVMLGDTASFNVTDAALLDADFTIADCTSVNIPVELTGATPFFAAYVSNLTIEHVRRCPAGRCQRRACGVGRPPTSDPPPLPSFLCAESHRQQLVQFHDGRLGMGA